MTDSASRSAPKYAQETPLNEAVLVPVAALICSFQIQWLRRVQSNVPQPYLDEVFHIPQADAYWQGRWSHWDDKITTPPGLYIFSVLFSKVAWLDGLYNGTLTPNQLRWTNTIILYALAIACTAWIQLAKRASIASTISCTLAIFTFPLFFFFSGLYYTDVFSAFTVIVTYCFWEASSRQSQGVGRFVLQLLHLVAGLVALTSRQTNIFWVAVFTGGLQAITTIKRQTRIHDPPVADAFFEDYPTMIISLAISAFSSFPDLLLDLWPQLALLASFTTFVVWNGGVVLGDKTNHVAGVHLAQMLYLWPFITFFSWPLALPRLADTTFIKPKQLRLWLLAGSMLIMLAMVRFSTIIHPFLLADNRHFTFYVFKALRTAPWKWYAAIPVYAFCTWLSVLTLGSRMSYSGGAGVKGSRGRRIPTSSGKNDSFEAEMETNRISFLLVWLLSTSLSLITAPLVELRYFILPWLIWRLHVPEALDSLPDRETHEDNPKDVYILIRKTGVAVAKRCVWIEIAWHMIINTATCWLFLYRGFRWPQEPQNTQRFMW